MTSVRMIYRTQISDTASIHVDAEVELWYMTVGRWIVEVHEGRLIVRGLNSPAVVLKVEA